MLEINKIYCGDNVELCKQLDDNSVDLTVTSPPYDNLRKYKGYSWDFESLANELYRVTKDGGVVVWVVGDATIKGSETGTSFKQALYFKEIGFNLHDTMIYKKSGVGACGSNYCYWQSFEYMFVLVKGKIKTVNRIRDRENKSFKNEKNNNIKCDRRNADGTLKTRSKTAKRYAYGIRDNIWEYHVGCFSGDDKTGHPAIFPEKLAEDHIISWSNEGDVVFDPFMGAGTTAKMALKNNRKFIGFELSQEYVDLANERINQIRI
jgi:site-specific DNA-methyltransferase (adenine-specific)